MKGKEVKKKMRGMEKKIREERNEESKIITVEKERKKGRKKEGK